eukprot:Rmarinus@m.1557
MVITANKHLFHPPDPGDPHWAIPLLSSYALVPAFSAGCYAAVETWAPLFHESVMLFSLHRMCITTEKAVPWASSPSDEVHRVISATDAQDNVAPGTAEIQNNAAPGTAGVHGATPGTAEIQDRTASGTAKTLGTAAFGTAEIPDSMGFMGDSRVGKKRQEIGFAGFEGTDTNTSIEGAEITGIKG